MSHDIVPHLKHPLHLDPREGALHTVEQDTLDEVAQCVEIVLATPLGTRLDLPEFGAPDFLFKQLPLDTSAAITAVATWEPRALLAMTHDAEDELTARVEAAVTARGI